MSDDPWLFPDAHPDICLRQTVRELLRRFGECAVRRAVDGACRPSVRCWRCRGEHTEPVACVGKGWRVWQCVDCGSRVTTRA